MPGTVAEAQAACTSSPRFEAGAVMIIPMTQAQHGQLCPEDLSSQGWPCSHSALRSVTPELLPPPAPSLAACPSENRYYRLSGAGAPGHGANTDLSCVLFFYPPGTAGPRGRAGVLFFSTPPHSSRILIPLKTTSDSATAALLVHVTTTLVDLHGSL